MESLIGYIVELFWFVWAVYGLLSAIAALNCLSRGRDTEAALCIFAGVTAPLLFAAIVVLDLVESSATVGERIAAIQTQGADYRNFWGFPLDVSWHANDANVPQTACRSMDYLYR